VNESSVVRWTESPRPRVTLLKVRRSRRISLLSLATEKHLVARAVDLYPVTAIPQLDGYDITGAEQIDFPLVRRISASFGRRCPSVLLPHRLPYRQQNLSTPQGADRGLLARCARSFTRIGAGSAPRLLTISERPGPVGAGNSSALIPMRTK